MACRHLTRNDPARVVFSRCGSTASLSRQMENNMTAPTKTATPRKRATKTKATKRRTAAKAKAAKAKAA